MNPPRFIFFDLGNVLLHFDHRVACRRLETLTGVSAAKIEAVIFRSGLQPRYESGEISSAEFSAEVNAGCGTQLDEATLLDACSQIFELNASIVPIVAQLSAAGYRLGILSNTCQAHWQYVSEGRYAILQRFFETRILSYEARSMKPDPPIYEAAIAAARVPAGQIFFTDDRADNVAGAQRAGLDATLFTGIPQLLRDLTARQVRMNL